MYVDIKITSVSVCTIHSLKNKFPKSRSAHQFVEVISKNRTSKRVQHS